MALFFQTIFLFCETYDSFEMINTEKRKKKDIIMILTVCYSNDIILVQVHDCGCSTKGSVEQDETP